MRATVKERYAESLYFLDAALADATIAQNQRDQTIETFLTGTSDEIEIQVKNVTLDDLKSRPVQGRRGLRPGLLRLREPAGAASARRSSPSSPSCSETRFPTPWSRSIRSGSPSPTSASTRRSNDRQQRLPRRDGPAACAFCRRPAELSRAVQAPDLREYRVVIVGALVVVFLNLFAVFYLPARGLFLKDTGRKLAHVERSSAPVTRSCATCPTTGGGGPRWSGEPMSINPFDDDNGGFLRLDQRRGTAQPVADLRRCSSRLAGGLRRSGPRCVPGLHRTELARYTAEESAREAGERGSDN